MSNHSVTDSATRKRIALIDADSICFAVALGAEMRLQPKEEGMPPEFFLIKSADEAYAEVLDRVDALVSDTQSDDAILALTTHQCFRYAILPTYKANRSGMHRPALLLDLHRMLSELRPYGVVAVRGLEADDVCAISSGHLQRAPLREPVVVSIDKDLKSVPGMVYSPIKPHDGIVEITEAEADRNFLLQTLKGDTVDGYSGCPGVGPVKAAKVLDNCAGMSMDAQWAFVLEQYKKRGLTEKDALTQARVARIVRSEEWDAGTRQVHLWSPGATVPEIMSLDDLPRLRASQPD